MGKAKGQRSSRRSAVAKKVKGQSKHKGQREKSAQLAVQDRLAAEALAEHAANVTSPMEVEPELTSPATTTTARKPLRADDMRLNAEQAARRREAIIFHFVQMREPPEELWRHGVLRDIADRIGLLPDASGQVIANRYVHVCCGPQYTCIWPVQSILRLKITEIQGQ